MRNNISILFLVIFCCRLQCAQSHLLSSVFDIRVLATQTVSELHKYISLHARDEQEQMQHPQRDPHLVSKYLTAYQLVKEEASKDVESYLANPVNEYLLIKLTSEWPKVRASINHQYASTDCNSSSIRPSVSDQNDTLTLLPTIQDVRDAALGLIRLQTTYALATDDLADGKHRISDDKYSLSHHRMTAGDCWELGREAYLIGEDETAMSWMEESLRRYHQEAEKTVPLVDVLKYYAFSSFENGNATLSLNLTKQLIELLPGGQTELKEIFKSETRLRSSRIDELFYGSHDKTYKALCRGENLMDAFTASQLYCTYDSAKESLPFLKLQPIKREHVSLNPPITVFHDVISDKEIDLLKTIAQPMMKTGESGDSQTGEFSLTQERVFSTADLCYNNHFVVEKVARRLQDITGLKLSSEQCYWMFNYGIGGHFSPHWDYAQNESLTQLNGNNIATLLLYLNEVESGGATVFPEVKAIVRPEKGSAAFWFNLLPSGRGNPKTLHAGCPVLAGSKWVIVKTFSLNEQIFRRPCLLSQNAEV